jgi:hypothetical protein
LAEDFAPAADAGAVGREKSFFSMNEPSRLRLADAAPPCAPEKLGKNSRRHGLAAAYDLLKKRRRKMVSINWI